ncbi:MAG: calcium/proton exchanger [Chloroflexota bacterium]
MKYIYALLIFVPLAVIAELAHWSPGLILVFSALGMIPLAGLLGEATEELAALTGPKMGGFLNATLGNAAELIITIVALKAGQVTLVKASITGSILGNLLLILGFSMLLGGFKNGFLRFDRTLAGVSATMMILAVIGLIVPTVFEAFHGPDHLAEDLEALSLGVAGVLLLLYVLSVVFTFTADFMGREPGTVVPGDEIRRHKAAWSLPRSASVLAGATLAIVFLSEFLVGAVEPVVHDWGISEFFLGIILVPIVGNVAEHLVGVQMAIKNRMDLSLSISLGSSMQIALFVAPLLVFVSLFVGPQPMNLYFHTFEVVALGVSVLIAALVSLDGESHWLEGAQLLAVYTILGIAFFFLPTG